MSVVPRDFQPVAGAHYGIEFPTPHKATSNDFPAISDMLRRREARRHFFEGLNDTYDECLIEGRLSDWASAAHAIIQIMANPSQHGGKT